MSQASKVQEQDIVAFLSLPSNYDDRLVLVTETHITCVFLMDRYADKLKKLVKFDFLILARRSDAVRRASTECN